MHNNFLKLFNEKTQQYEAVVDMRGVMEHFGIYGCKIRSLNALRRTRPDMRNPFPAPVKIVGKNHWFYNEIRQWQLTEALYYKEILDCICGLEEANKRHVEALRNLEKLRMTQIGIFIESH